MEILKHLFSPIKIRNLEIPNRGVMPPMGTNLGERGMVSPANLAYIRRRAESGIGLIITEIIGVHPSGTLGLAIFDDKFIPGLKQMADVIHAGGSKAALQLHHAGREAFFQLKKGTAMGPSAIPSLIYGIPPKEMTQEDIAEIVESFAHGAVRAREAGYDAVEIHAAHGYLLTQFLSALSNQRTDQYGGSFRNRARFVLEVVTAVRKRLGEDFPVLLRISVEEVIKGGYSVADIKSILPDLVSAGVDVIHASVGTHGSPGGITSATAEYGPGWNVWRAREIKQTVDIPVIAVGRFVDPALADAVIARGDADMVAFGRQILADPDFLRKAREGRSPDIRRCLACNQGCIERLMLEAGSKIRCAINPETGQELIYPTGPASTPHRVWIIGGGPAGLTAAYEAARLGHEVTLFEKETELGGQVRFAGQAPYKQGYADWVTWLAEQIERKGVKIHRGTEVNEAMLAAGDAEVVILAAGAEKIVPPIEGLDHPMVCDPWQVLDGRVPPGRKAVVVGGGLIGMETADFLIEHASDVVLVEMLTHSPVMKFTGHGYHLHKRLRDARSRLLFNTTVERITGDAVVLAHQGKREEITGVDQVIVAVGMKPRDVLKDYLTTNEIRHFVVGDANRVRRIIEATEEGAKAAWEI